MLSANALWIISKLPLLAKQSVKPTGYTGKMVTLRAGLGQSSANSIVITFIVYFSHRDEYRL